MSKKAKRFLISTAIVIVMFYFVDPLIVDWMWSGFPASAHDWIHIIRFVLYIPVVVLTFWVTLIIVGIFLGYSSHKDNIERMAAFKKKHDFPKGW